MKKLWQKNWELDKVIETFETKDDIVLDQNLIIYDIYGSIAHAKMLNKIGILSLDELHNLMSGLLKIKELYNNKSFNLQAGDEDIHTKIETYLTTEYGDIGKKIHTGRSRNDQVLTAIRLYTREMLFDIWESVLILTESMQSFAVKYEFVPMPGYTHTQKAMPSSVGMWAGALVEGLLDDLVTLKASYKLINTSPLGSGAGYGVPLELDREYVAKLLGFSKVQINSLYCQNSRGKFEGAVLASLNTILFDINKLATDIVLFTSSEFGLFKVADTLTSGSSIMPQKRNVDIAELLRSKIHIVLGNYVQMVSLSSNLISGYNRDLQDSKKSLMESLQITLDSLRVSKILIMNTEPQKKQLSKAMTPEIFATRHALELVKNGVPFREAYQTVASQPSVSVIPTEESYLRESTHLGGTGNLCLSLYKDTLKEEKEIYKNEKNMVMNNLTRLLSYEE